MSRLLLVLLVAHIGAALYHQVIRRDRLMGAWGWGRPDRVGLAPRCARAILHAQTGE